MVDDPLTRPEDGGCRTCGGPIPGRGPFCSRACYHESRRIHIDPIVCRQCGDRIHAYVSTNRPRLYCSRDCWRADIQTHVTKTCPECGKDFTIPAVVADRYTVCSAECRAARTDYADCPRCGKRFARQPGHTYCSEECRRPPVYIDCLECGRSFRVVPSIAGARRFCSFACYRRHSGETAPETAVRLALDRLGVEYTQECSVGRYSVDFAIGRVALEVDGAYWHPPGRDAKKTTYLIREGWCVLRVDAAEVMATGDLDAMLAQRLKDAADLYG